MKSIVKKFSFIFISLLLTASALLQASCGFRGDSYTLSALGSPVYIEVYSKPLTDEVKNQIEDTLLKLENEFSVSRVSSTVYKINENLPHALSSEAKSVLTLAKEYYDFSGRKFNPAVYPLTSLWRFGVDNVVDKEDFTPPSEEEIKALTGDLLDFGKITIDNDQVVKSDINAKIDLGGMLKGYASNKVLEILKSAGYTSGYVSFGSSSICILEAPELSVINPLDKSKLLLTANVEGKLNLSVSTSGDYEKYYDYEGKRYSHIIDCSTGKPYDTGVRSATVFSKDGAFADAMTTALCLSSYSPKDLENCQLVGLMKKIISAYPDSEIYAVYSKDGVKQLITNKKQGKDFALLDKSFTVVNI